MKEAEQTIVQTTSGMIKGSYEDGLCVFRGIPYAAPPVGKNRWLPPQPIEPWAGVRTARTFGTIAPQQRMQPLPGQQLIEELQNEDCLYLNVWTPGADNSRRPVMVWIHGGAFSMGSGSSPMYPGGILPRKGNVVYVSMNYRVGPLGFLRLKEITGDKIPATGNEGLLDQIAALQWVHDNITAFGGDPDNVTIFGESAGAMSIGCLLAMPRARGLYKKAILQSGANTVRTPQQAARTAEEFLKVLRLGPRDTEAIKSISVDKLVETQGRLILFPSGQS